MKGLPLAYSKDMQDDKQPVFEAHDLLSLSLAAMAGMVETHDLQRRADARRRRGRPRHRHRPRRLAGARGGRAVPRGASYHRPRRPPRRREPACRSGRCPMTRCAAVDERIEAGVFDVLSPDASVKSRTSHGGTAPGPGEETDRGGEEGAGDEGMKRIVLLLPLALGRLRPARAAGARPGPADAAGARHGEPADDHRRIARAAADRPPGPRRRAAAPLRGARATTASTCRRATSRPTAMSSGDEPE